MFRPLQAAKKINKAFKIDALQNRVSPETESIFNDSFWQGLDLVVNALDNVNARLYVDSRQAAGHPDTTCTAASVLRV